MNIELNEKVYNLIKNQIANGRQNGVQVCAYQYGKKIIDTWAGTMGPNDPRPIQNDSHFCCASTTKGVTSTALHILADKNVLDYDEPVTKYWPEFGKYGKDKITIAQAFSHQTGVYKRPKDYEFDITDWELGIKYIENSKPAFEPVQKQRIKLSLLAGLQEE